MTDLVPVSDDERLRLQIERLKGAAKLPDKAELEGAVEGTAKCAMCDGGIRALIDEVHLPSSPLQDLDFLVALRCRNAACAWTSRQWRPWSAASPLGL